MLREAWDRFSQKAPMPTYPFQIPTFRTLTEYISAVLDHLGFWRVLEFLQSTLENLHNSLSFLLKITHAREARKFSDWFSFFSSLILTFIVTCNVGKGFPCFLHICLSQIFLKENHFQVQKQNQMSK